MTSKSVAIISATLITLSLSLAQAAVKMPGTITVADLAKETLARKSSGIKVTFSCFSPHDYLVYDGLL